MQTADYLDPIFDFVRIGACIDDLIVVIAFRRGRLDLVGLVRVDEADNEVLHAGFFGGDRVGNFEQPVHRRREMRHVVLDLVEAVLDALGDLDFTLAGQQLHRAHLAHIHAHGVGGAAKLRVDTGKGRFGFFCRVIIVRHGRVRQQYFLGLRRLFIHRDAHVVDHVHDIFDLLGIDNIVRKVVVDFRVGQETLFLATGNQVFELLRLLIDALCCTFFAQGQRTSK